jgi:hypothetical protein
VCSPAKWQVPTCSRSAPENFVYCPTFQYEYEPFVYGLPCHQSTVAWPFHCFEMPGSTGSICPRNCCAREDGVPEPKLAPTLPPV